MNALTNRIFLVVVLVAGVLLAGCVAPYRDNGNYGYQDQPYGGHQSRCQFCGVVQEVQQVYTSGNDSSGTLGAVIGALAGGVLGNTVGKGDGRTAATVAGAVAGGVIGNQVGKRNEGDRVAWRIVVRLDDGQYATVTQRDNPGVRRGDYVEVRGGQVYPR
jgi:outer membrane lipoprotein SlyB